MGELEGDTWHHYTIYTLSAVERNQVRLEHVSGIRFAPPHLEQPLPVRHCPHIRTGDPLFPPLLFLYFCCIKCHALTDPWRPQFKAVCAPHGSTQEALQRPTGCVR